MACTLKLTDAQSAKYFERLQMHLFLTREATKGLLYLGKSVCMGKASVYRVLYLYQRVIVFP